MDSLLETLKDSSYLETDNSIARFFIFLLISGFLSILLGALTLKIILMGSEQSDFSNFLIIKRFICSFGKVPENDRIQNFSPY